MLQAPQWALESVNRFLFDGGKLFAMAFGTTIFVGGPRRMSNMNFRVILEWAPWWMWGLSLLVLGVWTLMPWYATRCVGYSLIALWFWVWDAAMLVSTLDAPPVPPGAPLPAFTGITVYFATATLYTMMAVAMGMSRTDWKRRRI